MAMGVRATLTGGALVEADRGCRRPHAGAVGAAEVGTLEYDTRPVYVRGITL